MKDPTQLLMPLPDPNPNHIDPVQVREGPEAFELSLELRKLSTIQGLFDSVDGCLRYLTQETKRKMQNARVNDLKLRTGLLQTSLRSDNAFADSGIIQIDRHEASDAFLRQF
jgi:hypothetical protein